MRLVGLIPGSISLRGPVAAPFTPARAPWLACLAAALGLPLSACTVTGAPDSPADPQDPASGGDDDDEPQFGSELASCLAGGGELAEDWWVDNGHGTVLSAAHSAAGLSVLGSEDGVLKSWEIASGELSGSFSGGAGGLYGEEFGPGSLPTALGFDGEGGMLAAGFADGSVRLYEPASGGDLAGAPGAGSPVRAVAVDATGGTVAWTDDSFSGTPRVWDGDAASAPATLETGLWGVSRAKFRQSDGVLVLAGHWYGVPALDLRQAGSPWDSIGWWMAPLDGSLELDTGNAVADLLLSEDGGVVFAGGRGFVLALDLATLAEGDEEASADYGVLEGHDVVAMALLPGGERFVSAGREGRLVVWDSQTLQPVAAMETGGEPLALHWDEGTGRLVLVEADGPLRLIGCGLAE